MEKHRILLEVCATDAAASALQSHFHTKYAIPCNRIQYCRSGVQGRRPSALRGCYLGNSGVSVPRIYQCIRPGGDLADFHDVAIGF